MRNNDDYNETLEVIKCKFKSWNIQYKGNN